MSTISDDASFSTEATASVSEVPTSVDVVGDARDDRPGRRAVEERQRQVLDVVVELVAQIGDDALADVLGEVGAAERRRTPRSRKTPMIAPGRTCSTAAFLAGEDVVEDVADQERHDAVGGAEQSMHDDGADEVRPHVGAQVDEQAAVERAVASSRSAPAPGARRASAAPGSPSVSRSSRSAAASSARRAVTSCTAADHRRRRHLVLDQLGKHARG